MPAPSRDETPYRLADGLFPIRLEPGRPLLMGREGSRLLIELWTPEMQGIDAVIVYDPAGARPTPDALRHALEPLAAIVGKPFEPPATAPPGSCAFRWSSLPTTGADARKDAGAPSTSAPAPSADAWVETWLDEARIEAMLWSSLETTRKEGKSDRDVIMAVWNGGNRPGFAMLVSMLMQQGFPRPDAERRARSSVHTAEMQGGKLLFQAVDTVAVLRDLLQAGEILAAYVGRLDAALASLDASGVPEGHVRAVIFGDDEIIPRLVRARSTGERAAEAREEEKDAILQGVLDQVGEQIRAQHAARRKLGNAPHNLAILVEELENGELTALVAMRSQIAGALSTWGDKVKPIVKELGKSAPAGTTHAIFAMRREGKLVLIHRMTVVQGVGGN